MRLSDRVFGGREVVVVEEVEVDVEVVEDVEVELEVVEVVVSVVEVDVVVEVVVGINEGKRTAFICILEDMFHEVTFVW